MPSPKKTLLLVVTSADRMGTSPHSTGYWLEEVVAPYYVFVDAGYDVHIASPKVARHREMRKATSRSIALKPPLALRPIVLLRLNWPTRSY